MKTGTVSSRVSPERETMAEIVQEMKDEENKEGSVLGLQSLKENPLVDDYAKNYEIMAKRKARSSSTAVEGSMRRQNQKKLL